jgi:hypothetical protein
VKVFIPRKSVTIFFLIKLLNDGLLEVRTQTRKIVDRNLDSTFKRDVEQWMKYLKEKNKD